MTYSSGANRKRSMSLYWKDVTGIGGSCKWKSRAKQPAGTSKGLVAYGNECEPGIKTLAVCPLPKVTVIVAMSKVNSFSPFGIWS